MPDPKPHRTHLVLATLASLAWIGLVAGGLAVAGLRPSVGDPAGIAALILVIVTPLTLIWALAAAFRPAPPAARPAIDTDVVDAAEVRLVEAATRLSAMREALRVDVETLTAAAEAVETRAARARDLLREGVATVEASHGALATLEAGLPRAQAQADAVRATIADAGAASREWSTATETLLAGVWAQIGEGQAQAEGAAHQLRGTLATLRTESADTAAQQAAHARAIDADARAARTTVAAAVEQLRAAIAEARAALAEVGSGTAEATRTRLASLAGTADALTAKLAEQDARAGQLADSAERAFAVLDKKLGHAAASTQGTLDQLNARLNAAAEVIQNLGNPLGGMRAAVGEIEAAVAKLRETSFEAIDALGATLPAQVVRAVDGVDTIRGSVGALMADIAQAQSAAARVADPVVEGREAIERATAAFSAQRDAIEAAGTALTVELEQARQLIAEVEGQTEATSLAAATRLVDAMSRVREVANQAAGTMRTTLEGVIAEAREALARAGDEAVAGSFAGPVETRLADLQLEVKRTSEFANQAANRIADGLLRLAEASTLIEDATPRTPEPEPAEPRGGLKFWRR